VIITTVGTVIRANYCPTRLVMNTHIINLIDLINALLVYHRNVLALLVYQITYEDANFKSYFQVHLSQDGSNEIFAKVNVKISLLLSYPK